MAQVYLAGPINDGENPYQWHQDVAALAPEIDWCNPFTLNDYSLDEAKTHTAEIFAEDLQAVQDSAAVLVRRIDEYNLCGASMEAFAAYQQDIPVIVWNDADTSIPLFLEAVATDVYQNMSDAVEAIISELDSLSSSG